MFLQELKLTNFKNCESADICFSDKINCFVGLNGAGKTNVLDSIYYLAFCKSYFTTSDRQNICHGKDFFAIHGDFVTDHDETVLVSCVQKENSKKSFKFNKKEYGRLAEHIGKIPLVMISPYDRDLINGGSELRRKFVDGVISQFDTVYLDNLLNYNKSLLQRNTLLKSFADNRYFDPDLLSLWDEQLVRYAAPVFERRKDFVSDFLPVFQKYYDIVSGTSELVDIQYESNMHDKPLDTLLHENKDKDRYSTYTNAGPHKDDFIFNIDGHQVKRFGSQGQQKSFVVAIKLAQYELFYNKIGFKPILLLDDVFDKLDDNRVAQLVKLVGNEHFGQVFISDTQRQRIQLLLENIDGKHKIFNVKHGVIIEDE
ncbi:MAG: DNA replication/repair protein RecF [Candidatus Limimorpha sp.]